MDLAGRRYGHIRVDRMLGQGGMGDVYEGFDERLARRVALKVLNREGQLDEEARARLIREARTLSKLDHPNICRIYDFIDDGANDVLVLELIDGRTLQDAMIDGLSTAEKLRIAHDVASVLVAAHRAGIIHRDLKPDNVMLTKSGQVKVLDFGLARWLKRKSGKSFPAIPALPEPRLRPTASHPETTPILGPPARPAVDDLAANATAVGLTVGTPLFMSPEQARGEPLTTASDIYSFGLMLQAMFTGKDPYPPELTSREIMIRASRGDTLPLNAVRRDMAALIKTFKALAPSDRPTAGDALRRITRIIDMPKRIARRAAVAALVALFVFSGWKYTTDLKRERTAAQKAEVEARQRRADADSLIAFMLGDLRTKLEPVGRLDVLDAVAERSLAYMSSLDPKTLSAQELARNSKALNNLAQVRIDQGRLRDAESIANRALSVAESAAARDPKSEDAQLMMATSHFWVGNVYRLSGDMNRALTHMRAYRDTAERLSLLNPVDARYQMERGYGHAAYGAVLEAGGKLDDALREYQTALGIHQRRRESDPDDGDNLAEIARNLNKVGVLLNKTGDVRGALLHFQQESAIYEQLVAANPQQTVWQARLAMSYGFTSASLVDMGDADTALEKSRAELKIEAGLRERDAENAMWSRNYAVTQQRIGGILRGSGRLSEAMPFYEVATAGLGDIARRDPNSAIWKRDFCAEQTEYARALLVSHNLARARSTIESAVALLEGLKKLQKSDAALFGLVYLTRGDIAEAAGAHDAAASDWAHAVAVAEPLRTARDARSRGIWARVLLANGKQEVAKPVIAQLHSVGYHNRDLDDACVKRGC